MKRASRKKQINQAKIGTEAGKTMFEAAFLTESILTAEIGSDPLWAASH
jgi:hypothetical protein